MTTWSPSTRTGEPADLERPLILIVDDNDKNLKLARDVLAVAGFRTIEAATGCAGIALACEHQPDVILMDLRLPDMDGTEAARRLAEDERTRPIPVVALSSAPFAGDGNWFLTAGFAGYLEKPLSVRAFPDQVRSFVGGGRSAR